MRHLLLLFGFVVVTITSFDYTKALYVKEEKLVNICMYTQQKLGASLQLAIRLCNEIKKEISSKRKERR